MTQKPKTNLQIRRIFVTTVFALVIALISATWYMRDNIAGLLNNRAVPIEGVSSGLNQDETEISVEKNSNHASDLINLLTSKLAPSSVKPINHIDPELSYQDYLLNISFLAINFLQDKNYSDELKKIEIIALPNEIKNILSDFDKYNTNYLQGNFYGKERVFPKDFLWIERFIKIEKQSSDFQEKDRLRFKIIEDLEFFMKFFFSENIQSEFSK